MTINTQKLRGLLTVLKDDECEGEAQYAAAQQIVAAAAGLLDHIEAQAAEIAEAKGQFEHLDRQNNALRDVLRSLADIDLAGPMPNDFAWFVLRARAALSGESK